MKFPGECPSEVDSFEVSSQVSNCAISREFTTEAMVQQHSVDFLSHAGHTVLNGERSAVSVNSGADLQGVSCRTGGSGVALMRRDELCEEFASQCFSDAVEAYLFAGSFKFVADLIERQEAVIDFQAKRAESCREDSASVWPPGSFGIPASGGVAGRSLVVNEVVSQGGVPCSPFATAVLVHRQRSVVPVVEVF